MVTAILCVVLLAVAAVVVLLPLCGFGHYARCDSRFLFFFVCVLVLARLVVLSGYKNQRAQKRA